VVLDGDVIGKQSGGDLVARLEGLE
jgi:hypothetical protein